MLDVRYRTLTVLFPGVAQLVARVIWDHEAQSSNLCTRTKLFGAHGSIIFGTETKTKIQFKTHYSKHINSCKKKLV